MNIRLTIKVYLCVALVLHVVAAAVAVHSVLVAMGYWSHYLQGEPLAALGFLGFLLQRSSGSADQQWLGVLGGLCLAAGMSVMVAGMIAERKQAEKKGDPGPPPA